MVDTPNIRYCAETSTKTWLSRVRAAVMAASGGVLAAVTEDNYTTTGPARPSRIRPASYYSGLGPTVFSETLVSLQNRGFAVVDGWIPPAQVRKINAAMRKLEYRKTLQRASTRSDRVVWLSEQAPENSAELDSAIVALKSIAADLGDAFGPLEVPSRVMGSVYVAPPPADGASGGYVPHRDHAPPSDDDLYWCWKSDREQSERRLTAILYVNDPEEGWDGGDCGGELRLFLGADLSDSIGDTASEIIDVPPIGGTLVIFDARTTLHAVLPVSQSGVSRYALSCWILSPPS